jgi:acetylornithine/succinyldiaminopimelate/putrescine aminotransferase
VGTVLHAHGKDPHCGQEMRSDEDNGTGSRGLNMDIEKVRGGPSFLFRTTSQDLCFRTRGVGVLYDLAGRRYIDMVAGIAVNSDGLLPSGHSQDHCEQASADPCIQPLLVKVAGDGRGSLVGFAPEPLGAVMFCTAGPRPDDGRIEAGDQEHGRGRVVVVQETRSMAGHRSRYPRPDTKYQSGVSSPCSRRYSTSSLRDVEQLKSAVTKDTPR